MVQGLEILAHPRLIISTTGFLQLDIPNLEPGISLVNTCRTVAFFSIREISEWLRWESMLSEDPKWSLSHLDMLAQRSLPPATLMDAIVTVIIERLRDLAYLENHYYGRIDSDLVSNWIKSPTDIPSTIGQGLRGDAILFTLAMAREYENPLFIPKDTLIFSSSWMDQAALWFNGPRDCSFFYESAMLVSDTLIDRKGTGYVLPDPPTMGTEGRSSYANICEAVITAWEAESFQRCTRSFAILKDRPTVSLPVDAAEAESDPILSPFLKPDRGFHLSYERLGPARIRISISKTSPLPILCEPARLARSARFDGTPAGQGRFLLLGRTNGIEADITPSP